MDFKKKFENVEEEGTITTEIKILGNFIVSDISFLKSIFQLALTALASSRI